MILLHVFSEKKESMDSIADFLLRENLAKAIDIDWNRKRMVIENEKILESTVNKLTCVTRASLFSLIDNHIRADFPNDHLEIYSIPLVHLDWKLVEGIREVSVG